MAEKKNRVRVRHEVRVSLSGTLGETIRELDRLKRVGVPDDAKTAVNIRNTYDGVIASGDLSWIVVEWTTEEAVGGNG